MALDGPTSLLIASLDLKLVQLLRDAMNTGPGRGLPASDLGPAPTLIERRFRVQPETVIEPRKRVEPAPLIEPREVIRPADRYEPNDTVVVEVPVCCYKPPKPPAVEPPWRVLPWEDRHASEARPVTPKIKVEIKPPDIAHKGSLIDFFM